MQERQLQQAVASLSTTPKVINQEMVIAQMSEIFSFCFAYDFEFMIVCLLSLLTYPTKC